jgi:hypothetical protein
VRGPLDKTTNQNTIFPFVFLLGNHSSGKSSFVNYLLNRRVQTAGVAPTDDSFTIIAPGPRDVDRDGPAFIGDPDMGFSGLKSFGPTLIHHTQLKVFVYLCKCVCVYVCMCPVGGQAGWLFPYSLLAHNFLSPPLVC